MTNIIENWLPIKGYEGLYEISDQGRVKSLARVTGIKGNVGSYTMPERLMKLSTTWQGYIKVCLAKDGVQRKYSVHRLVCLAFISNVNNKPIINHKDGDRANNHVNNLEWCTQSENAQHAYDKIGHTAPMKGFNNNALSSIPIIQMDLNGNEITRYPSAKEAKRAGFNNSHIAKCCLGKRDTHAGYKWSYA